jgi:hypothetical protein
MNGCRRVLPVHPTVTAGAVNRGPCATRFASHTPHDRSVGLRSHADGGLRDTRALDVIGPENVFRATTSVGESVQQAMDAARAWIK